MTPAPPHTPARSLLPLPGRLFTRGASLAGLGILGAILATWLHRPVAPGVWHDDAVYLLLGEALGEGRGYVYAGVPGDPPAAKFPPGYPLLLAVLGWGAGGDVVRVAGLAAFVNLGAVVATALALAHLGIRRLGLPPAWATGAGAAYLLLVDPWLFALPALSESLAVLAMVLAVGRAAPVEASGAAVPVAEVRAQPGGRLGEGWVMAVPLALFAVAVHLRSAALPLGLALALAALVGGGRRRGAAMGVAVAAVAGPWLVASALRTRRIPTPFRDILGGYGDWIRPALADPGGFLAVRASDGGRMAGLLGEVLFPWAGGGGLRWAGLALAVVLAGAGLHGTWRRSRTAVLLPAGLALQLLLWPWAGRRMLLPLLPWVVLGVALGLRRWAAALRPGAPSGAVVLLGGLWMGGLAVTLARAGMGPDGIAAPVRAREATLTAAAAAVRDWVPPGRTVGAPELWAAIHLETGHPVVPSAPFRADAQGMERAGPPEEQLRLWAVADFSAVVAEAGIHDRALELLQSECGPGAFAVPAAGPGFRLVLLSWDEACRRRLVPGWGGPTGP